MIQRAAVTLLVYRLQFKGLTCSNNTLLVSKGDAS